MTDSELQVQLFFWGIHFQLLLPLLLLCQYSRPEFPQTKPQHSHGGPYLGEARTSPFNLSSLNRKLLQKFLLLESSWQNSGLFVVAKTSHCQCPTLMSWISVALISTQSYGIPFGHSAWNYQLPSLELLPEVWLLPCCLAFVCPDFIQNGVLKFYHIAE